jgi:hypothetical protein
MSGAAAAASASGFLHNAAGALWTTQSKAAAEAAAVTGGGAAGGLWSWNRGYYAFDAHLRWARFNMVTNMAIAQTGQYREDIEDLASLTSNRMDNYHILGVMALTIATALFCPGRLGLHTPPPSSWLMGLFMCNLAAAYLWLGMTMWMAMHAALRADSAACHMLTRMVRLPVPSQRQLDRARLLFSSWEGQNIGELFRVPFLMKHGRKGERVTGDEPPQDAEARDRARCELDVPAWFRRERMVDEGRPIESFMPRSARAAAGATPEHFEVFRVIQNEYWPFDIYARLSMFLSWMSILHAWGYYNMGHVISETRAIWAGFCVCVPLFVAQNVLLTLDIHAKGIPWHRLGPIGLLTAYVAQTLEYVRWFSDVNLYLSAIFVFATYFMTIIYTVQLYKLAAPSWDSMADAHESPSAAWWPAHWRIPTAWAHSVWLVAPPKERAFGEHDIVDELRRSSISRRGEIRAGSELDATQADVGDTKGLTAREDVHNAFGKNNESPAWFFVRTGLQAMIIAWIWLTFGYLIDLVNEGTTHPSLLNAFGLPNNLRDPRWRPPKPGYHCAFYAPDKNGDLTVCIGQEVGTGGYYAGPGAEQIHMWIQNENIGGGYHRRLKTLGDARKNLGEKIRDLLPHLQQLIHDREDSSHQPFGEKTQPAIHDAPAPLVPSRATVEWPNLFEPRLLACGPNSPDGAGHVAAALSRHGRGALITSKDDSTATSSFVLEGAASFGPFLAAHWDSDGLVLTTSTGRLLECPGSASGGRWRCQPLAAEKLPLGLGSQPFAGSLSVARRPVKEEAHPELLSAVVFPGELSVALYRRAGGKADSPWLPAGEARTPSPVTATSFVDNAESLLMLLADGAVAKMRLSDGQMALAAEAMQGPAHTWQATCGLANSKVARLGVRPLGPAHWEPSLIFGA